MAVKKLPDQPAAGNDEHGVERDCRVEGFGLEVAVKQDQGRTQQPHGHMQPEPDRHGPQEAQRPETLAKRIDEQRQKNARTGNPEPIADARVWHPVALVAIAPAEQKEGGKERAECEP